MQDRLRSALKRAQLIEHEQEGDVRFISASLRDVEASEAVWEITLPGDFRSFLLEYGVHVSKAE